MDNVILSTIKVGLIQAAGYLNTLNEAGILAELDMVEKQPVILIADNTFNALYGDNFRWMHDFGEYYHKAVLVEGVYIASHSSTKKPQLEVEDEIAE